MSIGRKIFKKGEIVYYNGEINKARNIKHDKPYEVWDFIESRKTGDNMSIMIPAGDILSVQSENFISEKEYKEQKKQNTESENINNNKNETKGRFQPGEIVYYVGDDFPALKKKNQYTVLSYKKNKKTGNIEFIIAIGVQSIIMPSDKDFISEKEKKFIDNDSKFINQSINLDRKRNNFKAGQVIFYNPKETINKYGNAIEIDEPYVVSGLLQSPNDQGNDIFITKKPGDPPFLIVHSGYFVTEDEYRKIKRVDNIDKKNKKRAFNIGQQLYYIGDQETVFLKYNVDYYLGMYYPLKDKEDVVFYIKGVNVFGNSWDFVTKSEYDELKSKKFDKLNDKKYQRGDIVYYVGKPSHPLENDVAYTFSYYASSGKLMIQTSSNVYNPVTKDEVISEKDYLEKKHSSTSKYKDSRFNEGDIVYYVGQQDSHFFKPNVPFAVYRYIPGSNFEDIIFRINGITVYNYSKNFIKKEEYEKLKKEREETKNKNFKAGDNVYLISDESKYGRKIKRDTKYKIKSVYSKSTYPGRDITIIDANTTMQYVSSDDFIKEEDYLKHEYANNVSDMERNKRKFEAESMVYYIGTETDELKNDEKYEVKYCTPIYSNGNLQYVSVSLKNDKGFYGDFNNVQYSVVESKYLITKEEYDNLEEGKRKSDFSLNMKIFKDTKDDKLTWTKPYSDQSNYFRSVLTLENPKSGKLRMDLKKLKDSKDWELSIYFHRKRDLNDPESVLIRKTTNDSSMKRLAEVVKTKIESLRTDDMDQSTFD